ncbi:indolepyruvate ferredoxin oxidoreductase family protein [Streptomyces sp. NPDC055078]
MTIVDGRSVSPHRPFSLDDRYLAPSGTVHMTGVQALVRLLLDQRRRDSAHGLDTRAFVSGYEGSPLAGLDIELGRRQALLDEHGVLFTPGLNEEAAAMAVQGTQLASVSGGLRHDGVVGLWYGKAPGLDRATDALRHANLMGTHHLGGALAVVGDDPAAKSSSVPCASEFALADLAMPTLHPADPAEVVELGMHGVALSRAAGLWAAMKITTAVADGASTGPVGRFASVLPDTEIDGKPWRHTVTGKLLQPTLGPLERDLHRIRLELARRYTAANRLNTIPVRSTDDTIGIVASGKTWLDLRQALTALGLDDTELRRRGIRLLKLGMVWPLEPGIVREFASGLREIVVVEEKRAFVETALKEMLYGAPAAPAVHGKRGPDGAPLLAEHGELDPDAITLALASRLRGLPTVAAWHEARRQRRRGPIMLSLTPRTPYFCSGCPHNSSTKPSGDSLVGGGIGCHAMVLMMDPGQVGEVTGLTQMGGEGTQWIGMAPFVRARHLLQNLGDGTFHHSGSLAIRAAVAADVNITFKLLHNSTVAMTGGQDAVGAMPVPEITRLLAAEGVRRTIVTTDEPRRYRGVRLAKGAEVWRRDRLDEAQRVLSAVPGVTVLIHDQECAAEKRRKRKRGTRPTPAQRVMINERVCEGCGDCGVKSNCLSVQPVDTEFGRKTRIDQSSCNLDFSCLDGDCPSFLEVTPGRRVLREAEPLAADASPEPGAAGRTSVTLRLAGVGGTGVVTVAQILAVSAVLAGRQVRGLDQTGLAQKGGAVISDLRITEDTVEASGRLAKGECDLYLGADLLVAADESTLAVTDPARTTAIVSTAKVPTGAMVVDTGIPFPEVDSLVRRISGTVASGRWLDARATAEELFGSDQYANMLLVGVAYQTGALPLPSSAIEEAIRINGVAVERNIQAFRRGRLIVSDPTRSDPARSDLTRPGPAGAAEPEVASVPALDAPADSALARLVGIRVPELVAYQDAAYAARYVADVERVRAAEEAAVPGSAKLAETVAANLFKLLAYKDEYEVARLSLDTRARAEESFGAGARVAWKLHPPVLRALGMRRKVSLGPWFTPAFSALHAMRRLRGTRLDVFGYARVRRVERALIPEYRKVIEEQLARLAPDTLERAVEIAGLPDLVRGYEEIKLRSVDTYHGRLKELR